MSDDSNTLMSDMVLDDWAGDADEEEEEVLLVKDLDSRRQVENKLEDLRLAREISEHDFDF